MATEGGETNEKIINDAVLGKIRLHPLFTLIVDTPEFQRLKRIKQCGLCEYVYPTATHNRFSHSLGVLNIASKLIDELNRHHPGSISKNDKLCVEMAALCHDLGHGPLSHTWEKFVRRANPETTWKHENASVEVLNFLVKENKIETKLEKAGINLEMVADLILGNAKKWGKEKNFLFEIVANKGTGVDVDKWDSLRRDNYHFGVGYKFYYERLLTSIKIIKNPETEETHIAFRDKLSEVILEMFEQRAKMHRRCYQHRVAKIIEAMILDALMSADKYYKVKHEDKREYQLSKCQNNMEVYVRINDSLIENLRYSTEEELKNCRSILERIERRKFYITVKSFQLNNGMQKNSEQFEKQLVEEMENKFEGKKFCCALLKLDFGDYEDPLKNVKFFDKQKNQVSIEISGISNKYFISGLKFNYQELYLFCKEETIEKSELKNMQQYAEDVFNHEVNVILKNNSTSFVS